MAFTLKSWLNKGEAGTPTPLNAAGLKDIESRLSAYAETLISALSITTSKIANLAVTTEKLAENAVTTAKLHGESVTNAQILEGTITAEKFAAGSVGNSALANGEVTEEKLGNAAVGDTKIKKPVIAGAVTSTGTVELGTGFTTAKTAAGTYTVTLTTELAALAVIVAIPNGANRSWKSTPSKKIFTVTANPAEDSAFMFMIKVP